jgi:hypothetical protein
MKIRQVGVEMICAVGRTDKQVDDMTKLTDLLSNFTHAPKKQTKQNTSVVTEFSLPATLLKIIQ